MASPKDGKPGSSIAPTAPAGPDDADLADPGQMDQVKARQREQKAGKYGSATVKPYKPLSDEEAAGKKLTWIEVQLIDHHDRPMAGELYWIKLPDGSEDKGSLNTEGLVRFDNIEPGMAEISFPRLEQGSWKRVG